jgi:predicted kinase
MSIPHICYILIGPPGSGKSTLAAKLQTHNPHYRIISTDQIRAHLFGDATIQQNWPAVETEVLSQIQQALSSGYPIIYDATNYRRVHRLDLLQKLAHHSNIYWVGLHLTTSLEQCKQWNQTRDRQVDEDILHSMAEHLAKFEPTPAEGFAIVQEISLTQPIHFESFLKTAKSIALSLTRRNNRYSSIDYHRYSTLLNFERLLHLLSLIIHHPGIGNLQQTDPEHLQTLCPTTTFPTALAEITAIIAHRYGTIYADTKQIETDLTFLDQCGLFSPTPSDHPILLPPLTVDPSTFTPHAYADAEKMQRLLLTIRLIAHQPLFRRESQPNLENLVAALQQAAQQTPEIYTDRDGLRKDIERIFKPYEIFRNTPMRKGYFLGTGILSQQKLYEVFKILQSQEGKLDMPASRVIYDEFKARMQDSNILNADNLAHPYPIRAIANQSIVELQNLSTESAYHKTDRLEIAIEQGKLIEIRAVQGAAFYQDLPEKDLPYTIYPIQMVFHNIGWYLGYERLRPRQKPILEFARLDRIAIVRELNEQRSPQEQRQALKRLEKLYQASPSIYLGNSPEDQENYLSTDPKIRKTAEITLEIWFTDKAFRFIGEGDKRFPKSQMRMSAPNQKLKKERNKTLFNLEPSNHSDYPNRFQVTFPKWALEDIDLKKWIVSFGSEAKVIEPDFYAKEIYQFYLDAIQTYQEIPKI